MELSTVVTDRGSFSNSAIIAAGGGIGFNHIRKSSNVSRCRSPVINSQEALCKVGVGDLHGHTHIIITRTSFSTLHTLECFHPNYNFVKRNANHDVADSWWVNSQRL